VPDLLERQDDLGSLLGAVDAVRAGTGRVVLLTGEAGIGKTALVRALRAALDPEVRVLAGACDDLLAPRALGPLRDAAHGTGGPLERALDSESPDAVFAAALAQLSRPTLLVVEDVHWADDATLDVLRYLARRIDTVPALLLLTLRDEGAGDPVQQLLGSLAGTPTTRMELRPLSPAAVTRLAGPAGRDGSAVYAATGGNPFYVTEALAAPPDGLPAGVADAVLARMRRLEPGTVAALEQLSVVPNLVDLRLAEAVLGDGLAELAAAEGQGIVEVRGDGVAFRHDLARRALEQSVPRLRRRTYHRTVLRALRAQPERDLERLVHHAVEADDAATVVEFAPAAGRAAAGAGSHRQALAHFAAAAPHLDRLPPLEQAALLADHAWELHLANRLAESVAAGEEAVARYARLGDPVATGEATARLSRLQFVAGRGDEAQRLAEEAIRLLDDAGSHSALAAALTDYGALLVLTGRFAPAIAPLERARRLAAEVERADLESLGLNYLGMARCEQDLARGIAELREGIAVGAANRCHEPAARGLVNLAEILYSTGDWAGFAEIVEFGRRYVVEHGLWKDTLPLDLHRGLLLVHRGDWSAAEAALAELAERTVENAMVEAAVLATRARLRARQGHADAATMLANAWRRARDQRLPLGTIHAGRAYVEWAWLTGNPQVAEEVAEVLLPRMQAPGWAALRGELLRHLARAGLPAEPFDGCPEGYAAGLRGDWRAAAAVWERARDPYERALELTGSGEVAATTEGLRILDELGAHAPAALARRALRRLGVTRVPRGPVERANPAGLTDRQLDVLERLEAGDSNAEIAARLELSVRTVDHHVSAILARLGAGSRRQAVALARTWTEP